MKKPNLHRLAALSACLLCCTYFTIPAYAQSSEPQAETTPAETEAPEEPTEPNPFTPNGTGTVVDKATDKDGKEFYTITTPDENIFFLVIDNQKSSENVYFLNAVTEKDLLPLAEKKTAKRRPWNRKQHTRRNWKSPQRNRNSQSPHPKKIRQTTACFPSFWLRR